MPARKIDKVRLQLDYHFVALGADRFQSFCQALLTKRFDRIQCFPTSQPDGGRDASQRSESDLSDTTVFQVKFSNNPGSKEERIAVEDLIKTEKSKVQELVKRGAKQYIFMTNVKGTAHQDSGSIDRVNKLLTDAFSIPVFCYWEDELSRELDGNSNLKWSYPELIKATDLLEQLVFLQMNGFEQPQKTAIRSFLATQAKEDAKLKFKQVEIKEDIIDLFVDVPAEISVVKRGDVLVNVSLRQSMIDRIHSASSVQQTLSLENQKFDEHIENQSSAYQILTNSDFVSHAKRVVVEGAPGQGKSTITQFLSQVHRLGFLGRTADLNRLAPVYRPEIATLPIRVDIRDYATWLSGFNPFVVNEVPRPQEASDALETFLAWMINQTTGSDFTTDHLNAFFSQAQLLIVLDGFDEVAKVEIREQIVDQISSAAERLEVMCINFQIIVTSRPAAFANSPGFPRDEWTYVQLQSLTQGVINQYANQWLGGGIKDEKDKSQILAVLNEKLDQSHIKDLARNPMQLAILLSLISVQGASLPNQRTALYDRYIDIFFNRESEKSDTVRDNRATLIEIHQYLAWKLHSESELKGERKTLAGSISKTDLVNSISDFLASRGHDQVIVDELFKGLVERVVALVSRTQDTFEFEVQPLREYFAARWLYATSPYSPPGRVVRGTKTERFDAVSRNFYWQNVARFMAGCYDIGELASLEESVVNLLEDQDYADIAYPALLGMTLLNDYIFEQQPRLADRLVSNLTKSKSFRLLIEREIFAPRAQILDISVKSGRKVIINHLKSQISETNRQRRDMFLYSRLLRSLLTKSDATSYWIEQRKLFDNDRRWLQLGLMLDVYSSLPNEELLKLHEEIGKELSIILFKVRRYDFIDNHPKIWEEALKYQLSNRNVNFGWAYASEKSSRKEMATLPEVSRFVMGFLEALAHIHFDVEDKSDDSCLGDQLFQFGLVEPPKDISDIKSIHPKLGSLYDLMADLLLKKPADIFADIPLLDQILFMATEIWGMCWFIITKALFLVDKIDPNSDLVLQDLNRSKLISFLLSLKHTDLSIDKWNAMLISHEMSDLNLKMLIISAISRWAPDHVVFDKSCVLLQCIEGLTDVEARRLLVISSRSNESRPDRANSKFSQGLLSAGAKSSERIFRIFMSRFSRIEIEENLEKLLNFEDLEEDETLVALAEFCANISIHENREWDRTLLLARACHARNLWVGFHMRTHHNINIPDSLALEIMKESEDFPTNFVGLAERTLNNRIGRSMKPVAEIASEQKWFGLDGLPEI